MRFTVHGFKQDKLIELNLDNDDALILRYFIDFRDTEAMRAEIIEDETYYWIKYEAVINEIPILKLKKKDSLYRKLKKMANIGVLKHRTIRNNGTFSYFAVGEKYKVLISENTIGNKSEPFGNKSVGGTDLNPEGYGNKSVTNNSYTIYPSINNNIYSQDDESSDNRVPYNEIIKLFNDICKSLPKVRARSKVRDKKIKSMFRELGIENIQELFNRVEGSSFLSGKTGKWENCNFDWIVKQSNYIKVLEGTYDDKDKCNTPKEESNESTNSFNIILQEDM